MSAAELSVVVQSILTLLVLSVIVFTLWPEQRVDLFRQQMFAVRDELFDFAADGKISFEEPAYVLLRQLFNGFIRYAHNLTPYRVLMSFLRWKCLVRKPHEEWTASWTAALERVENQETKKALQQLHSRATDLVLGQLILSPTVLVIVAALSPLVVIVLLAHTQWNNLRSIYRDVTKEIPMTFLEDEAAKAT
jgi:hypothetical protein